MMENKNVYIDQKYSPIKFINYCPFLLAIIGVLLISTSLAVLLGWRYDIPLLVSIMPSWISMKINTAICFFLYGSALLLYNIKNQSIIIRIILALLSVSIILVSTLTIIQYVTGANMRIDQLIMKEHPLGPGTIYPGRMALVTSIDFILVGLTLLYSLKKTASGWKIQISAWVILFFGLFGLYNYIYEINMNNPIMPYTYMSIHTALLFILLSSGILLIKPQTGIMAIILRDSPGGHFMRLIIPIFLLIPIAVGIVENKVKKNELIADNFDDVLFAIGSFAFLSIAIAFVAKMINREENKLTASKIQLQENELIFHEFAENIDIVFFRANPDFTKIIYASKAYENIWGKTVKSLYKNPSQWFETILPEDQPIVYEALFKGMIEQGKSIAFAEFRIKKPDGSIRNIFARCFLLRDNTNHAFSIVGIAVDMTETKMKKKYIQSQSDVLKIVENEKLFIDIAPQILKIICQTFDWDLGEIWLVDKNENILRCFCTYDKSKNIILNDTNIKLNHTTKYGQGFLGKIWEKEEPVFLNNYTTNSYFSPINENKKTKLKSAIGSPILFKDKIFGIISFLSYKPHYSEDEMLQLIKNIGKLLGDFISKTRAEELIQQLSKVDAVTGLLNRTGFEENLNSLISVNGQKFIAVLIINIDRFKLINESLGHDKGNLLLKLCAAKLKETNNHHISLARLEGDVFILSYSHWSTIKELDHLLHDLKQKFIEPIRIDNKEITITVTFGIAIYPKDGNNCSTLIKNAGQAVTFAKNERIDIKFYNSKLSTIAIETLDLNIELYQAIAKNQLYLEYQPQIDLKTGAICGAEALVRWEHPTKGIISPATFIPVAEQTGLIISLNEHIMRMVFQYIRSDWSGLPISVNISAQQFNNGFHLVDFLKSLKEEFAVNPEHIELEITEGLIMDDIEHNLEILKILHSLGFRISIDDFGTGFSSFSYLHHIPAHKIKIDIAFIRGVPKNKTNVAIVKSMISLFHLLGKKVVAEGVETKSENEFLRQEKCDITQGYYYYKPMSADNFSALIAKKNNDKKYA